jgi:hypothetical protein
LPAFRFLHFIRLIRRNRNSEERKTGPTPDLSLDRTGFALDVTVFYLARAIVRASRLSDL